jgi:hypothetical protein
MSITSFIVKLIFFRIGSTISTAYLLYKVNYVKNNERPPTWSLLMMMYTQKMVPGWSLYCLISYLFWRALKEKNNKSLLIRTTTTVSLRLHNIMLWFIFCARLKGIIMSEWKDIVNWNKENDGYSYDMFICILHVGFM